MGLQQLRISRELDERRHVIGEVSVFAPTALRGKVLLDAANSVGDTTTTIVNASQAAARTYTMPDALADANFVLSEGAATINGIKTFGSAIEVGTVGITGANLLLQSLNPLTFQLNDVDALQFDNAAIASFAAATDVAGNSVFIETEDAGGTATTAKAGGLYNLKTGDGSASTGNFAGGAGGALTIQTGGGGANTGGGTGQAGGAGGAIAVTSGAGGATDDTGSDNGGAGGAITLTTGAGAACTGAGTGDGGAGGAYTITIGAGAATVGGTSGVGGAYAATAGAGSAQATNDAGGVGGAVTITSGVGGANTGAASGASGGNAGDIAITGAVGGASDGRGSGNDAGIGGDTIITAGAGGAQTSTTTDGGDGGAGGAASLIAGAAGAASGAQSTLGGIGGVLSLTSGAGGAHAGNRNDADADGGAGGALNITSGVGGASDGGNSGAVGGVGGKVTITAGVGGNQSDGSGGDGGIGGDLTLVAGNGGTSSNGTAGVDGNIITRGGVFMQEKIVAAMTTAATITDAQLLSGYIKGTPTADPDAYTLRTGTQLSAAFGTVPTVGDSFEFVIANVAGTGNTIELTGATGTTVIGDGTIDNASDEVAAAQRSVGTFLAVNTGSNTWDIIRK